VNKLSGGLVFGATLIAGAIVRSSDPRLGTWLMLGSLLPLAWMMMGGRGRHGGR
jgi:hypothetical protein